MKSILMEMHIYDFVKNLKYYGNIKLCEHVYMNRMILNNGGKIFIYPKLMMGPHKIRVTIVI